MRKKDIKKDIKELTFKLGVANKTVCDQMKHIEMLNKQLDQQDKAIQRKDKQFLGLRCAYQDEIINRGN